MAQNKKQTPAPKAPAPAPVACECNCNCEAIEIDLNTLKAQVKVLTDRLNDPLGIVEAGNAQRASNR